MTGPDRVDLGHLGLGPVTLVHGDLATLQADVLVNEANNYLQMSSGVSGALRSRGGMEIHIEAVAHAPKPMGRVIRTSAGKLDAKAVYHAVLVDYTDGRGMSSKVVASVVEEVLAMAEEEGFVTIAMPLFGAGGSGLAIETSLAAMVEGLEAAGRERTGGGAITIAVRDADDFERACEVARSLKAGEGRRAEESQLAEDFLAELMGSMGDLDLGSLE